MIGTVSLIKAVVFRSGVVRRVLSGSVLSGLIKAVKAWRVMQRIGGEWFCENSAMLGSVWQSGRV